MRRGVALSAVLVALLVPAALAYRVIQDDYMHDTEEPRQYFEPYHPGFVGTWGEPTNPRR